MAFREARSPYDVLNVTPNAPPGVVDSAYRALMKTHHPDRTAFGGATHDEAAEINAAYAVLKDPVRRAAYDRSQAAVSEAAQRRRPPPYPGPSHSAPPPPVGSRPRSRIALASWFTAGALSGALALAIGQQYLIAYSPGPSVVVASAVTAERAETQSDIGTLLSSGGELLPQLPLASLGEASARPVIPAETAEAGSGMSPLPVAHAGPRAARSRPPKQDAAPLADLRARPSTPDEDFVQREGLIY